VMQKITLPIVCAVLFGSAAASQEQHYQICQSLCWRKAELQITKTMVDGKIANAGKARTKARALNDGKQVLANCQYLCTFARQEQLRANQRPAKFRDPHILKRQIDSILGANAVLVRQIRNTRYPPPSPTKLPRCRPIDVTCSVDNDWCRRVPVCR